MNNIFKLLKEKKKYSQLKILYLVKVYFKIEDEIKTYSEKQKWKKFIASKFTLYKIRKVVLQTEGK